MFFRKLILKLKLICSTKPSSAFTEYLREKGIDIGDGCFFQYPKTITIDTTRPLLIEIGENCRFLRNFTLLTHDSITKVFGNVYHDFLPSSGPVKIGNNVYFARNCTVLKGVTIGDNCIIGYGSIVTKDIPANSVAVGVPAKVICSLDDYYKKRKKESLLEAQEYVRIIYRKTGKKPTVEQLYEEFPFWMEGNQQDSRLKFSVSYQTRGFYDYWRNEHRAIYRSFEEFVEDALQNTK